MKPTEVTYGYNEIVSYHIPMKNSSMAHKWSPLQKSFQKVNVTINIGSIIFASSFARSRILRITSKRHMATGFSNQIKLTNYYWYYHGGERVYL